MFLCNNQLPKSHRRLTLSHQNTALRNSSSVRERVKMAGHLLIYDDLINRYEQICNEGS